MPESRTRTAGGLGSARRGLVVVVVVVLLLLLLLPLRCCSAAPALLLLLVPAAVAVVASVVVAVVVGALGGVAVAAALKPSHPALNRRGLQLLMSSEWALKQLAAQLLDTLLANLGDPLVDGFRQGLGLRFRV